jgi:hypothetical protein
MGLEPARVEHIRLAGDFLGNLPERAIDMAGDRTQAPSQPFAVLPAFSYLLRRLR